MGVLIKVINASRVEATGPALDAMNDVTLLKQELGEIRAILAGDARDQGHATCTVLRIRVEGRHRAEGDGVGSFTAK